MTYIITQKTTVNVRVASRTEQSDMNSKRTDASVSEYVPVATSTSDVNRKPPERRILIPFLLSVDTLIAKLCTLQKNWSYVGNYFSWLPVNFTVLALTLSSTHSPDSRLPTPSPVTRLGIIRFLEVQVDSRANCGITHTTTEHDDNLILARMVSTGWLTWITTGGFLRIKSSYPL